MIYITAGHSSTDPGAVANGTTEHTVVKGIAERLVQRNSKTLKLVPIGPGLRERIAWINTHTHKDDLLISLHMNSANPLAHGAEIFYQGGSESDKQEASRYIKIYSNKTELWNRGAKTDYSTRHGRLGIIRDTKPRAFLIELGFISNMEDLVIVRNTAVAGLEAMLQLNNEPMKDRQLAEWEEQAMKFGEESGIMTGGRPLDNITRVEVAEVCRKLYTFLLNKFHS